MLNRSDLESRLAVAIWLLRVCASPQQRLHDVALPSAHRSVQSGATIGCKRAALVSEWAPASSQYWFASTCDCSGVLPNVQQALDDLEWGCADCDQQGRAAVLVNDIQVDSYTCSCFSFTDAPAPKLHLQVSTRTVVQELLDGRLVIGMQSC